MKIEVDSRYTDKQIVFQDKGLILEQNYWNDYGYETTFEVYYHSKSKRATHIGVIQIAHIGYEGRKKTYKLLQEMFSSEDVEKFLIPELSDEFVTLGDADYYHNLYKFYSEGEVESILNKMNDLAFDLDKFNQFKNETIVQKSLLRGRRENTVINDLSYVAKTGTKFRKFIIEAEYSMSEEKATFEFVAEPNSELPTNIHALIGANGSGKTQFINDLTRALISEDNNHVKDNGNKFSLNIKKHNLRRTSDVFEVIDSVVLMSFSSFDSFDLLNQIKEDEENKFPNSNMLTYTGTYMGTEIDELIYSQDPLSAVDFLDRFKSTISKLKSSQKKIKLFGEMLEIIELENVVNMDVIIDILISSDEIISKKFIEQNPQDVKNNCLDKVVELFAKSSSGQKIVLLIVATLVIEVNQYTLVLMDEPELYLHPPLISNLIRVISEILMKLNGLCILTTHSPIILQEIPNDCIYIVSRNSDEFIQNRRPKSQTFGENLSTLTNKVFDLEAVRPGYHKIIDRLSEKIDAIDDDDVPDLGRDARTYLQYKLIDKGLN